ncbi:MAG: hypothetical protein PGMFKBFP_00602 [Anaerolineales bacterium]|nr:hypothetical protein [Anaerolineales bacterium]
MSAGSYQNRRRSSSSPLNSVSSYFTWISTGCENFETSVSVFSEVAVISNGEPLNDSTGSERFDGSPILTLTFSPNAPIGKLTRIFPCIPSAFPPLLVTSVSSGSSRPISALASAFSSCSSSAVIVNGDAAFFPTLNPRLPFSSAISTSSVLAFSSHFPIFTSTGVTFAGKWNRKIVPLATSFNPCISHSTVNSAPRRMTFGLEDSVNVISSTGGTVSTGGGVSVGPGVSVGVGVAVSVSVGPDVSVGVGVAVSVAVGSGGLVGSSVGVGVSVSTPCAEARIFERNPV